MLEIFFVWFSSLVDPLFRILVFLDVIDIRSIPGDTMSLSAEGTAILKRELRKRIRNAVRSMSPVELRSQSEVAAGRLLQTAAYAEARNVGLYSSMPGELDTSFLLARALADEKRVFLPRVASKRDRFMVMLEVHDINEMAGWPRSDWNILEPPVEEGREDAPKDAHLDLIVVPGVAFDMTGGRCGQGMGFYDSYFARYAAARQDMPKLIALALAPQLVEEVPMTEYDVRVDNVLAGETSGA